MQSVSLLLQTESVHENAIVFCIHSKSFLSFSYKVRVKLLFFSNKFVNQQILIYSSLILYAPYLIMQQEVCVHRNAFQSDDLQFSKFNSGLTFPVSPLSIVEFLAFLSNVRFRVITQHFRREYRPICIRSLTSSCMCIFLLDFGIQWLSGVCSWSRFSGYRETME